MSVHVYIATTQGPVCIQGIIEEDADVQSVVCVDGGFEPLPISGRYHDFVKKGSGLLHKDFGGPAYRLDVSDRVDQGNSWQLAVYLAHYFHKRNQLGNGIPQAGDLVIWATGLVKANRDLAYVEEVPTKLVASSGLLHQLHNLDLPLLVLIPRDKSDNFVDDLNDWRLANHSQLVNVELVTELDEAIAQAEQLSNTASSSEKDDEKPAVALSSSKRSARKPLGYAVALSALIVLLGGVGWWLQAADSLPGDDLTSPPVSDVNDDLDPPLPGQQQNLNLDAELMVSLGAEESNCEKPEVLALQAVNGEYPPSPVQRVCGLAVRPISPDTVVLGVVFDAPANIDVVEIVEGVSTFERPRVTDRSRDYAIIVTEPALSAEFQRTINQLEQNGRYGRTRVLTALEAVLDQSPTSARIYTHTLQH